MNVQKKTGIISAVLFVFMLILAACPSAFVYLPNEEDRIPPVVFGPADRARAPQWFVRELGSNDPWGSPGTGRKVSFPHGVELIARSNIPGAVIYYESAELFGDIPPLRNSSPNSTTVTEDNPLTLSGSFSTRAYSAAVQAPNVHPSGSRNLIVTLYPDQSPTPLFTRTPGNYPLPQAIAFTDSDFDMYYNSTIYPPDTNGNNTIDLNELIDKNGDGNINSPDIDRNGDNIVNLSDEHVTLNEVSDPDPADFPPIDDDDPLSGVIDSSFDPQGYQLYNADNPISLIPGQTACIKAYTAQENYRPSRDPADNSLNVVEGCFSFPAAVPNAPTAPALTAGNAQLTASWTAPTNNGGSAITGYELQYRAAGTTPWTDISGITGASHTITGLTNGTFYEVQLRAVNVVGNGAWSTPPAAAAPVTVPSAPAAPTITPGNIQLAASWTAPNNGGSAITGYELQYRTGGGAWTVINSGVIGTSTSHTITGLTNGNSYDVQLRAINAQGPSAWSTSAAATPVAVPMAPTALTLTAGNAQIAASWTAPTDNGGSAITGYTLRYSSDGGTTWTPIASSNGTSTNYTITGLTNGTPYHVQVRAVNTQGNGNWSTPPATATPATVPSAPATPVLAAGNAQLTATWTAPNNGGSAITEYELQYREVGGAWSAPMSAGTSTNYTITGLTNGDTYDVQVRAVNTVGNGNWSTSATETPLIFVTHVPSGTATSARISAAVNNQISTDNLIVSLTTVTTPTTTVTLPTVNATTGVITVTASTTAGTYLVSGVDSGNTEQFSEHFYVTESPTTNAELDAAVTAGITVWGDTADLNYIITTAVTDMSEVFKGTRLDPNMFNGDISLWDVSSVTDMSEMFRQAWVFNGDISNWNTGAVTNMKSMFANAGTFNHDLNWNTSSVTNMQTMFFSADAFNRDLNWDTRLVETMKEMFQYTDAFNGDISGWDVSSVTDMTAMFSSTSSFNRDLNWNTGAVTDMGNMFAQATEFNGDISNWNTGAVTDMSNMFGYAEAFNGNIANWDVSSVTNMGRMFQSATAFNQNLEEWKDHWTLDASGKYTGDKDDMFLDSGLDTDPAVGTENTANYPSWY